MNISGDWVLGYPKISDDSQKQNHTNIYQLERNEGSGIEQWERLNYLTAATEGSAYHTRKSEAGLWEMSQMQARELGFYRTPANSRWLLAAPGWDLILGEGISLAESNSWRETRHWAINSQYTWWLRSWVPWSLRGALDCTWQDMWQFTSCTF